MKILLVAIVLGIVGCLLLFGPSGPRIATPEPDLPPRDLRTASSAVLELEASREGEPQDSNEPKAIEPKTIAREAGVRGESPRLQSINWIETSLVGVVDIDTLLDWMQSYASLPVIPKVDLNYWDSELAAFPMRCEQEGLKVFFCKELESALSEDGQKISTCQIRVELQPKDEVWMEGLLRERMRISISVSTDEAGNPVQIMAQLYAPVDLASNWDRGITFQSGEYREGLVQSYRLHSKESRCLPLFVRKGKPVGTDPTRSCESFFSPNEEKVARISRRLSDLLKEVSK